MRTELATPDQPDLDRSLELEQQIRQEMAANQGRLTFERYMQLCLYTEKLGYYTSDQPIFGEEGDFVTSSEKSAYFAIAFARHLEAIQTQLKDFYIIEVGAGSGRFAAQLIAELRRAKISINGYYIVETSAKLRTRQQEHLSVALPKGSPPVQWTETFSEPLPNAVVIANEVIDALPVRLLTLVDQAIHERYVHWKPDEGFSYISIKADEQMVTKVRETLDDATNLGVEQPYHTEICFQLSGFIKQIASFVQRGIFFFIDYGYPRNEYYHVQRTMGTLLCHYKNVAHENPLIWPGLQDISCNVDFTALANAGIQAGLDLNCYGTQTHFLLASNILTTIENEISGRELLHSSQQLKQLMMPNEMGERFQVMTFTKCLMLDHEQFTTRDLSYRL